ncbi:MAG TPA: DUF58 domain-containing protein [Polyangiaceae bacterium]|nr:DUF58 domain-containing protein [Polyangiaceae bacterium]
MIRRGIDWGEIAPLRLRAREVADGVYAGAHRSARRGAGVEFGGYREYVAGDDLRWLDRRSLLRHDRLVVRQFETETDRTLNLVLDASASMGFRGSDAPGAKFAFASLVGAALARIAVAGGDPVGLAYLAGEALAEPVGCRGGVEQFERIVASLEGVLPGGDARTDPTLLDRAFQFTVRSAKRGSIVVVLSDLLDLPEGAAHRIASLAQPGRVLVVIQTLDPSEAEFPFTGTVRLRALEGGGVVETNAEVARDRYLDALDRLTESFRRAITTRRGRFIKARTDEPAVRVVREVVKAIR